MNVWDTTGLIIPIMLSNILFYSALSAQDRTLVGEYYQ